MLISVRMKPLFDTFMMLKADVQFAVKILAESSTT